MNKPAAIAGASVLGVAVVGGTVFGSVKLVSLTARPAAQSRAAEPAIRTVTASPSAVTPMAADPVSPDPAPVTQASASDPTTPSAVVTQFYQDISNGDYSAAWSLGGDNIGGNDYSGWVAGYEDTTSSISVVTSSDQNDDTAYAEIDAVQLDGSVKTYTGTYTVQDGEITSANISQTS